MSHYKNYLIILLLLCSNYSFAQVDTIYFSKKWKVCSKDTAAYYRIKIRQDDKHFDVKDYYFNGVLQMTGSYTVSDSEYKDGYFVYYDSLGNKVAEGTIKNGKRQSEWTDYFYHTGIVGAITHYNNGRLDGMETLFYKNGRKKVEGAFVNGRAEGIWNFYGSDSLKFVVKLKNGKFKKDVFFYDKGKVDLHARKRKLMGFKEDGRQFNYTQLNSKAKPTTDISDFLNRVVSKDLVARIPNGCAFNVLLSIDKDGGIGNVFMFAVGKERYESEIEDAILKMPKWNAAVLNHRPIKSYTFKSFQYKDGKFVNKQKERAF